MTPPIPTPIELDGLPTPRRYVAAGAVLAAIVLAVLDGAIANVALPTMSSALGVTPAASVWIVTGYQMALVVSLLPFAALGESIGYRRVFTGGVVVFTAASVGCAVSPDLPVLVWYHGGGMVIGDLESADWVCRELCMQADAAVVSVAYRLAPEHRFPAAPEDAFAAACWVSAHASELGIDASRMAVGGDSAGGTLAAVTCLLARERGGVRLRSQLLVYPGTDGGDLSRASVEEYASGPILTRSGMVWFRQHYNGGTEDRSDVRAVPANAADHAGLPAAFVVTAEIDPLRDSGEHYGAVLARAGVLTALKRYSGVFHGFFTMGPAMAKTREAVTDAARFLRLSWEA